MITINMCSNDSIKIMQVYKKTIRFANIISFYNHFHKWYSPDKYAFWLFLILFSQVSFLRSLSIFNYSWWTFITLKLKVLKNN